jgi:hypothetical protein
MSYQNKERHQLTQIGNDTHTEKTVPLFQDNRSQMAAQLRQQSVCHNSPQQQKLVQKMANSNSPIQCHLYKKTDLRKLVKEAVKTAAPNSTAILLAIYNEMRFELDPVPAQYNSVVTARAALIAANRLDAEDANLLAVEAGRMQQAAGNPAEALRLRILADIAAKRAGMEGKYGHHVFSGDIKDGIPTGFHSKADGSPTHQAYGGVTDVGNAGAYQQSVRRIDNQVRKPIQSTFFPDAATHDNVIDAITVVYGVGLSTVAHVDPSVNGMRLQKKGDTVFPAGGSDTRFAE